MQRLQRVEVWNWYRCEVTPAGVRELSSAARYVERTLRWDEPDGADSPVSSVWVLAETAAEAAAAAAALGLAIEDSRTRGKWSSSFAETIETRIDTFIEAALST